MSTIKASGIKAKVTSTAGAHVKEVADISDATPIANVYHTMVGSGGKVLVDCASKYYLFWTTTTPTAAIDPATAADWHTVTLANAGPIVHLKPEVVAVGENDTLYVQIHGTSGEAVITEVE